MVNKDEYNINISIIVKTLNVKFSPLILDVKNKHVICRSCAGVCGKQHIVQNMTEQDFTDENPTTPITSPVEVTPSTTGSMTSSTAGFYFECAVVFIGVVGTAANALILYAMVASKQHKKQVLIFNQNALDCYSCLFLVITFILKLCNIYLSGTLGYWLCMILFSETLFWCGIIGSILNLAAITVERYLKVVHAVWSKKKLRKWMIYSAAAFSWFASIVYNCALNFSTSVVIDGVCYGIVVWKSRAAKLAHGIWNFASFYAFMLLLFIFCYWSILMAIRRQASVMAGHATTGPNTSQAQSNQIQSNIIKTMIVVCAFYAITYTPVFVYFFLLNLGYNITLLEDTYYAILFISFLYICANPFIYATKFDPVKRVLLGLIPCKKNTVQPVETVSSRVAATRTAHTQN